MSNSAGRPLGAKTKTAYQTLRLRLPRDIVARLTDLASEYYLPLETYCSVVLSRETIARKEDTK